MYYTGESLLELAVSLHEIELRMEFGNYARSKVGTSFKSIILCYSDSEYHIDIYFFDTHSIFSHCRKWHGILEGTSIRANMEF